MAHIGEEMLQAYEDGELTAQEELAVMEHIAECKECAGRFAERMAKAPLLSPPPDLRQEILRQTVYQQKTALTARRSWERSRAQKRELFAYGAKVVFAMTAAIAMLLTMSVSAKGIQQMPGEIMQMQQETVSTLSKSAKLPERDAGRKAEEKVEASSGKDKKKITDSLRKVSERAGQALSDFWSWME